MGTPDHHESFQCIMNSQVLVPRAAVWRLCCLLCRMGWSTRPWSRLRFSTWQWPMTGFSLGRYKFYWHVHLCAIREKPWGVIFDVCLETKVMFEQLPVSCNKRSWCLFVYLRAQASDWSWQLVLFCWFWHVTELLLLSFQAHVSRSTQ